MSRFAYSVTNRRLRNNNGVIGDKLRIYNIDRGTYTLGYVSPNIDATSPFARTKVHTGKFSGDSDIKDGELILDRYDNSYYFCMSIKGFYAGGTNGTTAFYDVTLYKVSATADIFRFGDTVKNAFGRSTSDAITLAQDVKIMVNPQNFSSEESDDRVLQANKIKVVLQSKVGVKLADRIVTDQGDNLIIENIDKSSLTGLWICMCDSDSR